MQSTNIHALPNVIQQYMMGYVDNKDLLNLRLVDKKINKNATKVLSNKLARGQVNLKVDLNKAIQKKVEQAIGGKPKAFYFCGISNKNEEFSTYGQDLDTIEAGIQFNDLKAGETLSFAVCIEKQPKSKDWPAISEKLYTGFFDENREPKDFVNDPLKFIPGNYEVKKFDIKREEFIPKFTDLSAKKPNNTVLTGAYHSVIGIYNGVSSFFSNFNLPVMSFSNNNNY